MSWFDTSIMATRGVAKGETRSTHKLGEAEQGDYPYIYSASVEPRLRVDPGAVIIAETHDAFEGKIRTENDSPSAILNFPYLNPQNGPIWVNGAEKGDVLAVYIDSIVPRGEQPRGTTLIMPEFGGLVPTADTALLSPGLPERVRKVEIDV